MGARQEVGAVRAVLGERPAGVRAAVLAATLRRLVVLALGAQVAWLVGRAATGGSADHLRGAAVLPVLLAVVVGVLAALERRAAATARARLLVGLRTRLLAAADRQAPGAATAVGEVGRVATLAVRATTRLVAGAVAALAAVVVLAVLSPWLALVLVAALLRVLLPVPAATAGERSGVLLGELGARVTDGVQGLRDVLATGTGQAWTAGLDARGRQLARARGDEARGVALRSALDDTVAVVGVVALLLAAGGLVAGGELDARWTPVVVVLGALVLGPGGAVCAVRDLAAARTAAAPVRDVLEAPAPVPDVTGPEVADLVPSLSLRDVSFRYGADGPDVLHEVSFDVEPGQTVALVGHSGAGKSTCAHLAVRLADATSGSVLVGGRDVRTLPTAQLRRTVALVPQDVYLFLDSLADNIRLGRPDASDEEVLAAARTALADPFVAELPQGYATPAGELGGALSGGQRQRLALARALLLDAPVLVLDEPVANLDVENERDLRLASVLAGGERTTLVVAHRLSTITGADRVVMLEQGRVLAAGTHTELLRTCPPYRELVANRNLITDDTRKRPPVDVHGT